MSKFPQGQLEDLEPDFVAETVASLKELNALGKPRTDQEVQERIDAYFQFCQDKNFRPGIESLCLSLAITRTTLFNWNSGTGCSPERQEIIQRAKAFIASFLEQAMTRGKISPPSGIFLMKNWLNYKDLISFEESSQAAKTAPSKPTLTTEEIMRRAGYAASMEIPDEPEDDYEPPKPILL